MVTTLFPNDKRKQRRLPAAELLVEIKSKQGLFSSWAGFTAADFNEFGLTIALQSEPELGSKTTLRLTLNMDMGDIRVNQIEAKIVNKVLINDGSGNWRVGLIFSSPSKQSADTVVQLQRIKHILEKNKAIQQRLREKKAG
jgi:hypothetical protein